MILTAYTPFFIEAQLFGEQGVGGSNQPKADKSSRPDQPFKQFLRGKGEEGETTWQTEIGTPLKNPRKS